MVINMTYTRGPWTVSEGWIYASAGARLPNYSNQGADIPLLKECHATLPGDLKLAASAPDMLAALEAIIRADTYTHERGEALLKARNAIRKAKGE